MQHLEYLRFCLSNFFPLDYRSHFPASSSVFVIFNYTSDIVYKGRVEIKVCSNYSLKGEAKATSSVVELSSVESELLGIFSYVFGSPLTLNVLRVGSGLSLQLGICVPASLLNHSWSLCFRAQMLSFGSTGKFFCSPALFLAFFLGQSLPTLPISFGWTLSCTWWRFEAHGGHLSALLTCLQPPPCSWERTGRCAGLCRIQSVASASTCLWKVIKVWLFLFPPTYGGFSLPPAMPAVWLSSTLGRTCKFLGSVSSTLWWVFKDAVM